MRTTEQHSTVVSSFKYVKLTKGEKFYKNNKYIININIII